MLEGTCRQRPHQLHRDASSVLRDTADLDSLIIRLDVVETDETLLDTYRKQVVALRDQATVYFEATDKPDVDPHDPSSSSVAPHVVVNDLFKLRKCAPPTFSGEPRDFPRWKEHFDSAVHNNPNLENKHRIIHLLAGMRGEAKVFMRGFQAIGDNYERALKAV